jgi:hypothetical protein
MWLILNFQQINEKSGGDDMILTGVLAGKAEKRTGHY